MAATDDPVRTYYGETLQSAADLRTTACCDPSAMAPHVKDVVGRIEAEVLARFYGCGSPVPAAVDGLDVLDLGCGTGRDAVTLAALGARRVIGVDMTPEQLEVAERHREAHLQTFGLAPDALEFRQGDIEALDLPDASVDLVVSNCVLNLAADKRTAFAEALRVLRPGGELFFSDVFADRRIPPALFDDPVLRGECLSGALYWEDFRRLMADLGVADVRVVARAPIELTDPEVVDRIGMVAFESITVRAFKLDLEDRCEDFGQVATYRGTIAHHPHRLVLDDHHVLETGRPLLVCGNTADMLGATRFGAHVDVVGDKTTHFGLFDCAPDAVGAARADGAAGACC